MILLVNPRCVIPLAWCDNIELCAGRNIIDCTMFSLLLRSVPSSMRTRAAPMMSATLIPTREYRSHRSKRGLYDGKDIRSGNKVSFAMNATKRKFRPNVFLKRLYSETLDAMLPFHVTTSALRSIDKAGGLDNYVLKKDCTEGEGFALKRKILKRRKNLAYLERKKATMVDDPISAASATDATTSSATATLDG